MALSPDPPSFRGGSGDPLVLFHGGTDTWRTWDDVIPALTGRFDVFAPTLPGHFGGPQITAATPSVADLVDDVEAMLDEAGITTAHLAGNSAGGWLAIELAARGRALSALAFSPAGGWPPGETRVPKLFVRGRRQARAARLVPGAVLKRGVARRLAASRVAAHGDRITHRQLMTAIDGVANCPAFDDIMRILRDSTLPNYSGLPVPALIAWGERDRLLPHPRYSQLWRESAPTAEFRILPDVGHVPMVDDPGLVARTIIEWVDSTTRN